VGWSGEGTFGRCNRRECISASEALRRLLCGMDRMGRSSCGMVSFFSLKGLGGIPREQSMLKGHLPRGIHHPAATVWNGLIIVWDRWSHAESKSLMA